MGGSGALREEGERGAGGRASGRGWGSFGGRRGERAGGSGGAESCGRVREGVQWELTTALKYVWKQPSKTELKQRRQTTLQLLN